MILPFIYIFGSVLIISVIALIAVIPFLKTKSASRKTLLILLGLSAGTLLGTVFIHFIPEAIEHEGYTLQIAITILAGFLVFFVLERLVHFHHKHNHGIEHEAHGHAYQLAPLNIIGDGIHNFLDGLVIAGSYLVSIPLGIAATISVMFHELPQEIADVGVLLYSGLSKKKVLIFNGLSAVAGLLGAGAGIYFASISESFLLLVIPFAAGNFLYIAASNVVPELHRNSKESSQGLHILAMMAGIALMITLQLWLH